jgi:hypothetical protein
MGTSSSNDLKAQLKAQIKQQNLEAKQADREAKQRRIKREAAEIHAMTLWTQLFLKHLRETIREHKDDLLAAVAKKQYGMAAFHLVMPIEETKTALELDMQLLGYTWSQCISQFLTSMWSKHPIYKFVYNTLWKGGLQELGIPIRAKSILVTKNDYRVELDLYCDADVRKCTCYAPYPKGHFRCPVH